MRFFSLDARQTHHDWTHLVLCLHRYEYGLPKWDLTELQLPESAFFVVVLFAFFTKQIAGGWVCLYRLTHPPSSKLSSGGGQSPLLRAGALGSTSLLQGGGTQKRPVFNNINVLVYKKSCNSTKFSRQEHQWRWHRARLIFLSRVGEIYNI